MDFPYVHMTGAEYFSDEKATYGAHAQPQEYPAYSYDSNLSNNYATGWPETYDQMASFYSTSTSNALDLDISSRMQSTDINLGLHSARSVSPYSATSSVPTPDQLLRLLHEPSELSGSYAPSEFVPLTVAPSELHSPSVSPAHSRNPSMISQSSYGSRFVSNNTEALYAMDPHSAMASENQYSTLLFAGDNLSPQSALMYSPLSSRRTSFQPATPSSLGVHSRSASIITSHSGRDDSGSSVYSPYTHGRTVSNSTNALSPIAVPVTPDIRANSACTDVPSNDSPAWSASSSTGGTFSKFPVVSPSDASKKRKRASVQAVPIAKRNPSMDSSEDEYVGVEDADASDEDFEEFEARRGKNKTKKIKGRTMKKQRLSLDGGAHAEESHNHGMCTWNYTKAGSGTQHGAEIKVDQLIPIDRDTVSCPHCGFIPGNRRFSDLKRHWEAHLVKEAKDKVRWVCLSCGDVEEIVVREEQEDGSIKTKSILEYVPKVPVLKKYTRKDSARRHWKQDHGEKNMEWDDGLVIQVDRVRGEMIEGQVRQ